MTGPGFLAVCNLAGERAARRLVAENGQAVIGAGFVTHQGKLGGGAGVS